MTPTELKALIDADQTAKDCLTLHGDYTACAARCSVIAPRVIRETRLSRLGLRALYSDPTIGQTVLSTIDAVAQQNPIVEDVRRFAEPGVHPSCLPDWGNPFIRAALTTPANQGGIGLTAEQAAPILAAAEYQQTISADDVAAAMKEGA